MDGLAVLGGFGVGAIVGLTGVGGGSLMTPLLLSVFKLNPAVAIGTDLWFAALTKVSGAVTHARFGHVRWDITRRLLLGSVPASVLTMSALHFIGMSKSSMATLTFSLGIALLLTALVVAFKQSWQVLGLKLERFVTPARQPGLTVAAGALLGLLVSLTSIGSGAIGATLILLLYPRLETRHIVGSDIAHAVPLTLVAGIGHAALGNVYWPLLLPLLIGSLPGIWVGAQLTRRLPDGVVRALLCASLVFAGFKVIL
ncbi:MAG TPA: sulfite exporter TauE/SafE family protein [Burkholderiaceae bacterium]